MDNLQWYEKSMHKFQGWDGQLEFCSLRHRNNTYVKDNEMELKLTEYEKLLSKRVYLLSYIDVFFKRCILLDETTVHN